MWEKENNQLQPPVAFLFHLKGEKRQEIFVKVTVQEHKLTERLRPNKIREHFSPHFTDTSVQFLCSNRASRLEEL